MSKLKGKNIAIIGAGGLGRKIANLSKREHPFAGYYDDKQMNQDYLGSIDLISKNEYLNYVVAIGNPIIKKVVVERLSSQDLYY